MILEWWKEWRVACFVVILYFNIKINVIVVNMWITQHSSVEGG